MLNVAWHADPLDGTGQVCGGTCPEHDVDGERIGECLLGKPVPNAEPESETLALVVRADNSWRAGFESDWDDLRIADAAYHGTL